MLPSRDTKVIHTVNNEQVKLEKKNPTEIMKKKVLLIKVATAAVFKGNGNPWPSGEGVSL